MKALKIGDKYLSVNGKLFNAPISDSIITVDQNVVTSNNSPIKTYARVTMDDLYASYSGRDSSGNHTFDMLEVRLNDAKGEVLSGRDYRKQKSVLVKPGTTIYVCAYAKIFDLDSPGSINAQIQKNGKIVKSGSYAYGGETIAVSYSFTVNENIRIQSRVSASDDAQTVNGVYTVYLACADLVNIITE